MEEDQDVLKRISARAILEFEDVKLKYKEYFEKCSKEEAKRRKVEAQFKQLKQVSLLAVAEYESLHTQYVEENKYREEIQKKLLKVTEENQEIRKQNKLGSNTTILPVTDTSSQGTKGELEVLRAMKDAVNTELRNAKNEINRTKEMLRQEKAAHEVTTKQLNASAQQINQLNKVSTLAIDEFNSLKQKLDLEMSCRKKAEDVATELTAKAQLSERKSRIINEDELQLQKFMEEIEAINAKAEIDKKEATVRIKELEEQLENMQDSDNTKLLEGKISLLMDQLDLSQKQLVDAEERMNKAETDSRNLYTRLAIAERQNDSSSSLALPPPPPPPPPPIAAPVIRKFIFKIGKRKKDLDPTRPDDDPIASAMADMIDRIKKGVKLRPVNTASKGDEPSEGKGAIGELTGLLTNLRQGREESVDIPEEDQAPAFTKFKLKKTETIQKSMSKDNNGPSNELKRKLEKQKSVADGVESENVASEPDINTKNLDDSVSNKETEVENVVNNDKKLPEESNDESNNTIKESENVASEPNINTKNLDDSVRIKETEVENVVNIDKKSPEESNEEGSHTVEAPVEEDSNLTLDE